MSEEEEAYFRRGRNLGHSSVPKHATVSDYRIATGMETLFGFLHLTGRDARISELFRLAYSKMMGNDSNFCKLYDKKRACRHDVF